MALPDANDLRSRISLLRLVGDHVQLRRAGAEYMGKCPFHKDDTPSFSVNPEKNLYHCHGCGASGDIFTWLEAHDGMDFKAALEYLQDLVGGPPKAPTAMPKGDIVKVYSYVDEQGGLLYEVCRKEWIEAGKKKKTFVQRSYDDKGRTRWTIKDCRRVLYQLPKVLAADEIWCVEGEKDADTLTDLGLVGTTIAGGAKSPWLASYTEAVQGKRVVVIPDNDEPGAEHAEKVLASIAGKCEARLVRVPSPAKDVTEWIEGGGTVEQLREWAAAAAVEAPRAPEKMHGRASAHGKRECNEIAEEILQREKLLSDQYGYVYRYNGRYWERITSKVLKRIAKDSDVREHTNQRRRGEIADYLEMAVQVPQIRWRQLKSTEVPLQNGVYDLEACELRDHRPSDYLETVVPIDHDPKATCPNWEEALWKYFGEDDDKAQKVTALRQFFGYVLLPHARYKKALILYGDSDTGKSQVAKLLQELVGRENCCGVSVENMDDERKRVPLVGKLLNVLTEISAKAAVADGGFKTLISTEEALLFDPKHLPPFMYTPIAKHVIATNNLPQVSDHTAATFNRLLLIQFNRVIPKSEQDPEFIDKLRAELPGILNWALVGAQDLTEKAGEWMEIPESAKIVAEYRRGENEINSFLEEKCIEDPDGSVTSPDLREKFRAWAGKNYSQKAIGNMMRHAGYPSMPHPTQGCRVHRGLRWREQTLGGW